MNSGSNQSQSEKSPRLQEIRCTRMKWKAELADPSRHIVRLPHAITVDGVTHVKQYSTDFACVYQSYSRDGRNSKFKVCTGLRCFRRLLKTRQKTAYCSQSAAIWKAQPAWPQRKSELSISNKGFELRARAREGDCKNCGNNEWIFPRQRRCKPSHRKRSPHNR